MVDICACVHACVCVCACVPARLGGEAELFGFVLVVLYEGTLLVSQRLDLFIFATNSKLSLVELLLCLLLVIPKTLDLASELVCLDGKIRLCVVRLPLQLLELLVQFGELLLADGLAGAHHVLRLHVDFFSLILDVDATLLLEGFELIFFQLPLVGLALLLGPPALSLVVSDVHGAD